MYLFVAGSARVHIGVESCEVTGPAVAYVPKETHHYVENICHGALEYVYVSIWPGEIPREDGRTWREACDAMIRAYESQGYSPKRS
jgi:mannose-6-phosphate isomerase-like protein (cupin superfamily)